MHNINFTNRSFIAGHWIDGENEKTFNVINPADKQIVTSVAYSSKLHTCIAINAANIALTSWKNTHPNERSQVLKNLYNLMAQHKDELAKIITLENGKILEESYKEIEYSMAFVDWFGAEARRVYGDIIPSNNTNQRSFNFKEPVGVVAVITPWNFPLAMLARKIAPAIAAGCTLVIKPSEETPLSTLYMAKLCEEAEIPSGVLNVVCGDADAIGKVMTSSPLVRMLTFTGSTKVGKMLMKDCSNTVKKVTLELGGNAPFIVFDDANLELALQGLLFAKFRNAGQSCIAANRIFLAKNISRIFIDELIKQCKTIKLGNGFDPDSMMGPLINIDAVKKIDNLILDAVNNGSEIIFKFDVGDMPSDCYYAPTIILNKQTNLLHKEEIFGPVISISIFEHEDEVISQANSTIYGLASYLYTQNHERIWRMSNKLDFGMIGVNNVNLSNETTSFGGIKESGLGREGGKDGINEYLEHKFLTIG